MFSHSSKQITLGTVLALALALGLSACDTVNTGAAHVANWVSGGFDHSQHETTTSMPGEATQKM